MQLRFAPGQIVSCVLSSELILADPMARRYRHFSRRSASGSYFTACKWCGERIHMRQMPHGQWVAFDGHESVHKCGQASDYDDSPTHTHPARGAYRSSPPSPPVPVRPSAYTSPQSQSTGSQPQSPTTLSTPTQPTKSEGWPAWVWWVIAIVILYLIFKK